jgi:hypothetical protein
MCHDPVALATNGLNKNPQKFRASSLHSFNAFKPHQTESNAYLYAIYLY